MDHAQAVQKVNELMNDVHIGFLTTNAAGTLTSRPMGLQEVEFDGDLWFFTYENSDKVREIAADPQVNVSLATSNSWVSLSGAAELVHDRAKAEELWSAPLKAWFPGGVEEPGLALIKVHAASAEYWDTTSNKAMQLFGFVKAAVTGEKAEGGENETVKF